MPIGRIALRSHLVVAGLVAWLAGSGAARPTPSQTTTDFPGWGLSYQMPAGWLIRQPAGRAHVLGPEKGGSSIFVAAGFYETPEDVFRDLQAFSQLAGLSGSPVEASRDTSFGSFPAVSASFVGQGRTGHPVHARVVAVFTPHRTGLFVLGVSTAAGFEELRARVEGIAGSASATAPAIDLARMEELRGAWVRFRDGRPPSADRDADASRGIEAVFEFRGPDSYLWKSSIYLAAEARGRADDPTITEGESDRGRYAVIGEQLVLAGLRGQRSVAFSLVDDRLVVDGATYFRRK